MEQKEDQRGGPGIGMCKSTGNMPSCLEAKSGMFSDSFLLLRGHLPASFVKFKFRVLASFPFHVRHECCLLLPIIQA